MCFTILPALFFKRRLLATLFDVPCRVHRMGCLVSRCNPLLYSTACVAFVVLPCLRLVTIRVYGGCSGVVVSGNFSPG